MVFNHKCLLDLSLYTKSILAFWAYDSMLSLCLRQTKGNLARGAFSVNVSFSVSALITHKLEISRKPFVFSTSFCDVTRHHSKEDYKNECPLENYKREGRISGILDKSDDYHLRKDKTDVAP